MLTVALSSSALDDGALQTLRLVGREALSTPFEFVVDVTPTGESDVIEERLDEVMRGKVRIAFRGDGEAHFVFGMVRAVELVPGKQRGKPLHRLTIVPRLWTASLTRRSRIFQNLTVPQIVHAVLVESGFDPQADFEFRLAEDHPKEEYVVQYEETDLDFVSRLLEDEGIFYFFEHGDEQERLILADVNDAARGVEAHLDVPFHDATRPEAAQHVVTALTRRVEHVPTAVTMNDYNWRNPNVDLEVVAPVAGGTFGLVSSNDDGYRDRDNGRRLARLRAEELAARRCVYRGRSSLHTLHAGDKLSIVQHSVQAWDQRYLVSEVTHHCQQVPWGDDAASGSARDPEGYSNELVAIELVRPWRPARRTARPRIHGVTYALIDSPDLGAAAPIDEHGRYKVLFPFDARELGSGGCSRWIRRAQPLAGPNYGMHFPLRTGTEVVVAYVHGDPDRPLIVGAVPNALTPSPVARNNATTNVLMTGSGARIEFEDNA